jgi:hypothetical protein
MQNALKRANLVNWKPRLLIMGGNPIRAPR